MTDRYVAWLNIEHFKKQIMEESDPAEMASLKQLPAKKCPSLIMFC